MKDLYQLITDRIVAQLEAGVKPWHQPWTGTETRICRPLRHNSQPYNGINILVLWSQAQAMGYGSPYWMTFQQALEYKACVRKGEKGTMVVYASTFTKQDEEEDEEKRIPFLKSYTVFNAEQIDGLPERFYAKPAPTTVTNSMERDPLAEAFFAAIPADVRHGGSKAFYAPALDYMQLPNFETFETAGAYYATRAHESAHWTRHETRLNRDFGRKRWGDEGYATEELVAEMAAAFIAADLGFAPQTMDNHASYLASWLKVLKNDKRAIFTAASYASKAADFLAAYSQVEAGAEAA